jgi:acetylornithine deacetylase
VDVFGAVEGRDNAVGRLRGAGGGRSLIFNGHVDVVPPGPEADWLDGNPWSGRIEDGKVFGRGACDMKAGIVAQAFAARALVEAGIRLRGDLILEAVVGEEMMEHHLGTTACINRGYVADAAVVAEPSGPPDRLAIVPVTSGVMSFRIMVAGKATHASMRGMTLQPGGDAIGVSAIDKAMLVYTALRDLERQWTDTKSHELFTHGHFAIYPGVFIGAPKSGQVPFFIADEARIEYVVVYSPNDSEEQVHREIEAAIAGAAHSDRWLTAHPPEVVWIHHWPPSVIDPSHPIVKAASKAHETANGAGARVRGFAAVDDATFLVAAGVPAITYGPGDIRIAHAPDEHVEIDELMAAVRTYALLAIDWCGVAE